MGCCNAWSWSSQIVSIVLAGFSAKKVHDFSDEVRSGAIAARLKSEETALVVAHDAVNKTILCDLLGLTPADIWAVKQGNGGVTVVDIPSDSGQPAVVTCLNLTSHFGSVIDRTAAGAL